MYKPNIHVYMWIVYMHMDFTTLSQFLLPEYMVDPIQTALVTVTSTWASSLTRMAQDMPHFPNYSLATLNLICRKHIWNWFQMTRDGHIASFLSPKYYFLTGLKFFTPRSHFLWVQRFPRLTFKINCALMPSFPFSFSSKHTHRKSHTCSHTLCTLEFSQLWWPSWFSFEVLADNRKYI